MTSYATPGMSNFLRSAHLFIVRANMDALVIVQWAWQTTRSEDICQGRSAQSLYFFREVDPSRNCWLYSTLHSASAGKFT